MSTLRESALRFIVFNELPHSDKQELEKVVIFLTNLTIDLDMSIYNYQRCLYIIILHPGLFPINHSLYSFIKHYSFIHKNTFMFLTIDGISEKLMDLFIDAGFFDSILFTYIETSVYYMLFRKGVIKILRGYFNTSYYLLRYMFTT